MSDATQEQLDAIARTLQGLAGAVEAQREDLRLALEVLVELAARLDQLDGADTAVAAPTGGLEVGALMGATQAAWLRLEQRLESEFAAIHRQLHSLTGLTETTASKVLEPPRSGPGADQLRRAASSLRDGMRALRRQRR